MALGSATTRDALIDLDRWRSRVVDASKFVCHPIRFAESREWRFDGGMLRHHSGGFFSVVGLRSRARHPLLDGRERVIILQPETAVNGFLVRPGGERGVEVLCQGRVEPGNIEAMQLAPTVQSTEANIERVHGGNAPPLVEWFLDGSARAVAIVDGLQSEEGSRYHGKYNRNVVLEIPEGECGELPPNFRWYGIDALRSFAVASNVLNTDSRSVLACADWDRLKGGDGPFASHVAGTFGAALRRSYLAGPSEEEHTTAELLEWLIRLRVAARLRVSVVPLEDVANWVVEADCIRETDRELGFAVRQYRVVAHGREVSSWDQPLIDSDGVGRVVLICQMRGGVLRFLVQAEREVGYLEGVQLSASITVPPGERLDVRDAAQRALAELVGSHPEARRHLRCRQSEEGGRFYQDENEYEIVELPEGAHVPPSDDYRWLSLAQIRRLIRTPGVFTMELRGALAMLFAYL